MKKKYTVLYTHQKKKKRKTWQDGILIVDDSGKTAVLKTEAKETLETVYIKQMVEVGDELESTKHLIQIEEIYNEEDLQPKPNNQMELEDDLTCSNPGTSRQNATCNNSRIPSMDLSRPLRKRTKFVIPRKVTSNQPPDENLKASAGVQSSVTNSVCDVRMEEAQTEKENIWTNVECCMEDSQHKTSNFCDQTARSTEEILEILRNAKRKKVETKEQHTPNCDVSEGNIPEEFISTRNKEKGKAQRTSKRNKKRMRKSGPLPDSLVETAAINMSIMRESDECSKVKRVKRMLVFNTKNDEDVPRDSEDLHAHSLEKIDAGGSMDGHELRNNEDVFLDGERNVDSVIRASEDFKECDINVPKIQKNHVLLDNDVGIKSDSSYHVQEEEDAHLDEKNNKDSTRPVSEDFKETDFELEDDKNILAELKRELDYVNVSPAYGCCEILDLNPEETKDVSSEGILLQEDFTMRRSSLAIEEDVQRLLNGVLDRFVEEKMQEGPGGQVMDQNHDAITTQNIGDVGDTPDSNYCLEEDEDVLLDKKNISVLGEDAEGVHLKEDHNLGDNNSQNPQKVDDLYQILDALLDEVVKRDGNVEERGNYGKEEEFFLQGMQDVEMFSEEKELMVLADSTYPYPEGILHDMTGLHGLQVLEEIEMEKVLEMDILSIEEDKIIQTKPSSCTACIIDDSSHRDSVTVNKETNFENQLLQSNLDLCFDLFAEDVALSQDQEELENQNFLIQKDEGTANKNSSLENLNLEVLLDVFDDEFTSSEDSLSSKAGRKKTGCRDLKKSYGEFLLGAVKTSSSIYVIEKRESQNEDNEKECKDSIVVIEESPREVAGKTSLKVIDKRESQICDYGFPIPNFDLIDSDSDENDWDTGMRKDVQGDSFQDDCEMDDRELMALVDGEMFAKKQHSKPHSEEHSGSVLDLSDDELIKLLDNDILLNAQLARELSQIPLDDEKSNVSGNEGGKIHHSQALNSFTNNSLSTNAFNCKSIPTSAKHPPAPAFSCETFNCSSNAFSCNARYSSWPMSSNPLSKSTSSYVEEYTENTVEVGPVTVPAKKKKTQKITYSSKNIAVMKKQISKQLTLDNFKKVNEKPKHFTDENRSNDGTRVRGFLKSNKPMEISQMKTDYHKSVPQNNTHSTGGNCWQDDKAGNDQYKPVQASFPSQKLPAQLSDRTPNSPKDISSKDLDNFFENTNFQVNKIRATFVKPSNTLNAQQQNCKCEYIGPKTFQNGIHAFKNSNLSTSTPSNRRKFNNDDPGNILKAERMKKLPTSLINSLTGGNFQGLFPVIYRDSGSNLVGDFMGDAIGTSNHDNYNYFSSGVELNFGLQDSINCEVSSVEKSDYQFVNEQFGESGDAKKCFASMAERRDYNDQGEIKDSTQYTNSKWGKYLTQDESNKRMGRESWVNDVVKMERMNTCRRSEEDVPNSLDARLQYINKEDLEENQDNVSYCSLNDEKVPCWLVKNQKYLEPMSERMFASQEKCHPFKDLHMDEEYQFPNIYSLGFQSRAGRIYARDPLFHPGGLFRNDSSDKLPANKMYHGHKDRPKLFSSMSADTNGFITSFNDQNLSPAMPELFCSTSSFMEDNCKLFPSSRCQVKGFSLELNSRASTPVSLTKVIGKQSNFYHDEAVSITEDSIFTTPELDTEYASSLTIDTKNRRIKSERSIFEEDLDNRRMAESGQMLDSRLTSNSVPVTNRFVSPVKEFTLEDRLCQKFFFSTPEDHREMKGKAVQRAVRIPLTFSSVQSYVTALRKAIHEHLNIVLWNVSEKYHACLAGADLANYAARFSWSYSSPIEDFPDMEERQKSKNAEPLCQHGIPGKLLTVNKEGKNKGRHFYVCSRPRSQSCKFFMWQESCGSFIPSAWSSVIHPIKLNNGRAVTSYLKRNGIDFYCECVFMRKSRDVYVHGTKVKVPEWIRKARGDDDDAYKGKIYIKLPRKESNSFYRKDDIWVISRTIFFKQDESFVARSTYHAPSSTDDLDIQPLDGYTPSHWNNGDTVFALHTFQASSELSCLRNLQDLALNSRTFPLLPHILNPNIGSDSHEENEENSVKPINQGELLPANYDDTVELAKQFILKYGLNEDQSKALHVVVDMVCRRKRTMSPVMLIHGCFGSGKSFLLSVMIIFLSEIAIRCSGGSKDFKILLSTLTNVAVDRVLLSLLDLGFTSFCRVGSLGRIASRVLPLSVHMTADSEHIRELQTMLRNPDLSQQDKHYIKLSLRNVRSGIAKKNLNDSVLVGVTCASTNLDCLKSISFPLVIIDECTQCTEPLSLLPVSNFNCKSMILCGDPNQLPPTVQSFSSHKLGLEQTLFDRLAKVGHVPIKLLTQYRCHPQISRIAGDLFYEGKLKNGITEDERPRILKNLPNLAFYDLSDGRAEKDTNSSSLRNPREASFVSDLVKLLVGHGVPGSNIGVVTMYKAQVDEVLSAIQFMDLPDLSDVSCIQVSTVDAFQGAEKDVIILSCVLTSGSSEFLDSERMCVALTRARNHLLIVGHKGFLSSRPKWQRVIESCGDSVQTYFQFRKIWGKKLKKATMQANSSANRLLLSPYSASEFSPADTDEQKTFEPVSDKGIASNELLKDDEIDS